METSDDGLFGGGGGVDIPTQKAENLKRTAEPVDQVSEAGRRRRRRRQASAITSGFGEPQLGVPALTGV